RQRLQFFQNQGIIGTHDLLDHNEAIFRRASRVPTTGGKIARGIGQAYVGIVNSVRESAKYAIAAQNLELLARKYGSVDSIPNDVMRKFVHDMKYLSGDMTKAIGNPALSKIVNTVPYMQTTINSTMHVADTFLSNKSYWGSRFLANWIAPKIFWPALLT